MSGGRPSDFGRKERSFVAVPCRSYNGIHLIGLPIHQFYPPTLDLFHFRQLYYFPVGNKSAVTIVVSWWMHSMLTQPTKEESRQEFEWSEPMENVQTEDSRGHQGSAS